MQKLTFKTLRLKVDPAQFGFINDTRPEVDSIFPVAVPMLLTTNVTIQLLNKMHLGTKIGEQLKDYELLNVTITI